MACLEDAVEFLRELVERKCYTFFSSGSKFRGRDCGARYLQQLGVNGMLGFLEESNSLAHLKAMERCNALEVHNGFLVDVYGRQYRPPTGGED